MDGYDGKRFLDLLRKYHNRKMSQEEFDELEAIGKALQLPFLPGPRPEADLQRLSALFNNNHNYDDLDAKEQDDVILGRDETVNSQSTEDFIKELPARLQALSDRGLLSHIDHLIATLEEQVEIAEDGCSLTSHTILLIEKILDEAHVRDLIQRDPPRKNPAEVITTLSDIKRGLLGLVSKESKPIFATPEGSVWEDVRMTFQVNDSETVYVTIKSVSRKYAYHQMGMGNCEPNKQWTLLQAFSTQPDGLPLDESYKGQIQRLRKCLKDFFGINDDPIVKADGLFKMRIQFGDPNAFYNRQGNIDIKQLSDLDGDPDAFSDIQNDDEVGYREKLAQSGSIRRDHRSRVKVSKSIKDTDE